MISYEMKKGSAGSSSGTYTTAQRKADQKKIQKMLAGIKEKVKMEDNTIRVGPMPDTDQYINRVGIKSESSNAIYVRSQRRSDMQWVCSCRGFISHRKSCKHIKALIKKPFGPAYPTYKGAKGNPAEWAGSATPETSDIEVVVHDGGRKINLDDE